MSGDVQNPGQYGNVSQQYGNTSPYVNVSQVPTSPENHNNNNSSSSIFSSSPTYGNSIGGFSENSFNADLINSYQYTGQFQSSINDGYNNNQMLSGCDQNGIQTSPQHASTPNSVVSYTSDYNSDCSPTLSPYSDTNSVNDFNDLHQTPNYTQVIYLFMHR